MKLEVIKANPAGNITLFVKTPVRKSMRAALAKKLMAMEEFAAEQVGFCCTAEDGFDGYMEMAGGEFCGNATRAYGFMMAAVKGLKGRSRIKLHVSGSDEPVEVDVDMDRGTARSSMPLPKFIERRAAGGVKGILVHLGGIAHFVVKDQSPSESFFEKAEADIFAGMNDLDAYGVMFLEGSTGRLTPLVKVPSANSLFWEGSCGSGSLSVAIAETEGRPDGDYSMDIVQPAGTVTAEVSIRKGIITAAYIGGSVIFDKEVLIEV